MRTHLALCGLALALTAPPSLAQAQRAPPGGSYQQACSEIRFDGQFLSALCRGQRGPARSSLNVLSCGSDIGVDPEGGLSCLAPGVAAGRYDDRRAPEDWRDDRRRGYGGYGRASITLVGPRGERLEIVGPTSNLARTGFNDRVWAIELAPRAGAWQVCADAKYRGRCVTVDRSVRDVREIGMARAISSLRPLD